ncbi:ABC transporter ATP-binding protein [Candidatus Saccharibacteria bacterium]|nr:ABC transporter ATP-binding protein [Candidatus Saccharibacteria bacterium]
MLKLLRFLKPYWWQIIFLLLTLFGQVHCSLKLPALMADIINNGVTAGDQNYILSTGLLMLVYALLSSVFAVVTHFFSARVGAAYSRDLREEFYKKVLSLSISEIDDFSTASLITRTTNDIGQVQQAVMMMLTMMLRAPLMGIGAIFQAYQTAPDMTWTIAAGVGTIVFFSIIILGLALPKFKIYQQLFDKITLIARENLTGLRVIRAFNNEKHEQEKFNHANGELTKVGLFIDKVFALQDPLISLIFNGVTLLVVWISINRFATDLSYVGNMVAFVQYASQVLISFLILTMLLVVLPRANVSAGRINEVLNAKPKIHWKPKTAGAPAKTPSVEFRNVDFIYSGAEENVLKNITFKAVTGETTAFIGSTGSGKSTLISLVPRFYEASSGEILINGLDIKNYSEDDLMRRIGYVPQRGILFSGTVKENIAFGNPDATDKEVHRSARIAEAEGFVERLTDKYDSHIAEKGTNVSGGQKQRLSIARALAKHPEIYIFDDSFSALDMKTDKKLRESLREETKDSVVLIVAQRINTIKDAEQIIVLDQGKIVGRGRHLDLLKSCPTYREIVKSQFSDAEFKKEMSNA